MHMVEIQIGLGILESGIAWHVQHKDLCGALGFSNPALETLSHKSKPKKRKENLVHLENRKGSGGLLDG